MNITGNAPKINNAEYMMRGPIRSHKYPINKRANMVIETEAIMILPISPLVKCSSSRTITIKGAIPNQPKKHKKKAIHVRWNAFMFGLLKLNKLILDALIEFISVRVKGLSILTYKYNKVYVFTKYLYLFLFTY